MGDIKVLIPSLDLMGDMPLDTFIDAITTEKNVNGQGGLLKLAYPFFSNSLFQKVRIIDGEELKTIGLHLVKWDENDRRNNPSTTMAKLLADL